ncbi:unnamed protein product [Thlaspi arvense]|uniref:CBF1-interacting co-repressor CIR N-terminal domain-containing protein n=1 Tax=Thlaspi arvense TaxID=13288 RepID=A0AAU9T7X4_THLAR|nr:unnamed protein product [Thlaspi arvense]
MDRRKTRIQSNPSRERKYRTGKLHGDHRGNENEQARNTRVKKMIPFAEVSERSENRESKKIATDAEDKLVDSDVESYFRNHMVSAIKELNKRHRSVRHPSVSLRRSASAQDHRRLAKIIEALGRGKLFRLKEMDGEEGSGIRLSKRFAGGKVTGGLEVEYKTKSGTAWSHSFLNQKPWHPLSYPNQRRKWIAEQTHAQHDRRAEEVAREFAQEQEFFKQAALISNKEREKNRVDAKVYKFGEVVIFYLVLCFMRLSPELNAQIEMMKAVSFMYVRPPGYDPESAKAAEYADEKHEGQSSSAQDPMADDNTGSKPAEAGSELTGKERKKPRPKDVFGRTLPTEEEFAPSIPVSLWKYCNMHETGIAGRAKPFAVELRNVKCLRCGNFGHQSGDRDCPLKDAVMPNEELRLKRDDPLTAIIAHTDPGEPLKWELKQKPGLSPPRGGFDLDDPNQQIVAEDIFDEYGGFLEGSIPLELLQSLSSNKKKKSKKSKSHKKHSSRTVEETDESSTGSEDSREKRRSKKGKDIKKKSKKHYDSDSLSSEDSDSGRYRPSRTRHNKHLDPSGTLKSDAYHQGSSQREKHSEAKKHQKPKKMADIPSASSDDSDYYRNHSSRKKRSEEDYKIHHRERNQVHNNDPVSGKSRKHDNLESEKLHRVEKKQRHDDRRHIHVDDESERRHGSEKKPRYDDRDSGRHHRSVKGKEKPVYDAYDDPEGFSDRYRSTKKAETDSDSNRRSRKKKHKHELSSEEEEESPRTGGETESIFLDQKYLYVVITLLSHDKPVGPVHIRAHERQRLVAHKKKKRNFFPAGASEGESMSLIHRRLNRFPGLSSVNGWNVQVREAVNRNDPAESLLLFREMKRGGFEPNNLTFPFVAKACARLADIGNCEMVHAHVLKSPFWSDVFVGTATVDMFVKCDSLDYAAKVFERMPERDATTCNAMLSGFCQSGHTVKAFSLFREMRLGEIQPDSVTVMTLIQSASSEKSLKLLKAVHAFGIRLGVDAQVTVSNTWISAYAKCNDLDSAKSVFRDIGRSDRTVVSWNSMFKAYAVFGEAFDAFGLYQLMLREDFKPDLSTFINLAASCQNSETLAQGRLIHSHAILLGTDQDIEVINTFISMYSKSGDICSARLLFDVMPSRTCVSWTVMISGYAEKGDMDEALALFRAMTETGVRPDLVTLLSLISGCGRFGSLEIGKWVKKNHIDPLPKMTERPQARCESIHDST